MCSSYHWIIIIIIIIICYSLLIVICYINSNLKCSHQIDKLLLLIKYINHHLLKKKKIISIKDKVFLFFFLVFFLCFFFLVLKFINLFLIKFQNINSGSFQIKIILFTYKKLQNVSQSLVVFFFISLFWLIHFLVI